MSLHNDYLITIMAKQRQADLLARAAEDRLARQLSGLSSSWWTRLVDRWRRPPLRDTRRAAPVRTAPIHSAPQPAD